MSQDLFALSNLSILGPASLRQLSLMLNEEKLLPTEDGKLRDWRGLAEAAGFTAQNGYREIEGAKLDHTKQLVSLWCQRSATVADLVAALEIIDRFDVVAETTQLIEEDCQQAANLPQEIVLERGALTLKDLEALQARQKLVQYDAMVISGKTRVEEAFALHLVQRMEAVGLNVFLPERDLLAGCIEHAASAEIITERCKKVLAIFSPTFLQREENLFYTHLAQYVGMKNGKYNVIPIMFGRCELPPSIQFLSKLPYDPDRPIVNFYQRLFQGTFNVSFVPKELQEYPEQFVRAVQENSAVAQQPKARIPTVEAVNPRISGADCNGLDTSSLSLVLPDVPSDPVSSDSESISTSTKRGTKGLLSKIKSKIKLPKTQKKSLMAI